MRALQPGTVIVTGADQVYFPLIQELFQSIAALGPDVPVTLAAIDNGLSGEQKAILQQAGVRLVAPPNAPEFPAHIARRENRLTTNLCKPWLDVLFPDASTIIFLDGDTWVQQWEALETLEGAAQGGALAIVADNGRYWVDQIQVRWLLGGIGGLCQIRSFLFKNGRHGGLPRKLLRKMGNRAQINAGVFALRTDAPHWRSMRAWQAQILRAGGKPFSCDQLAMGAAIYGDELPVELLDSGLNYIRPYRVDLSIPAIVEYYYPYKPVGIIHLAGQKRVRFDPAATEPVPDTQGRLHQLSLRFGHFQRTAALVRS